MAATASPVNSYRPLVVLGGIVLVTASLYLAQKILIPLSLAVLLAFILSPVVDVLQRRGLWRVPSVLVVVSLSFLLLGGIGLGLTLQLKSLAADLPRYQKNIAQKIAGLREVGQGTLLQDLQDMVKGITDGLSNEDQSKEGEPPVVRLESSRLPGFERAAGQAAEFLASAGLVVVLLVFMLIRREDLRNRLVRLVAHGRLVTTTRAFEEGARRLSRFLLMQLVINASFGLALGLGLFVIGVPYPLLWGILATTLRFLPYVGSLLTMVPLVLFGVAVFPTWTQPILVLALLVVLEVSTANVVEPLLFGHSTGVAPIALLAAAAFWTWLWGPIGLVLSTPLTACLVVLGRFVPHLEFLGVLLGDDPALDPEVTYYQRLLARDQDEATDLVEEFLQTHPREAVYDQVLAPALVLAKRDRESGALTPADEQFIVQVTRDIMDDLVMPQQQHPLDTAETTPTEATEPARAKVPVFGCPARDQEDELALHMFGHLLAPSGCQVEVLSAQMLTGEVVSRVQKERPAIVCIAALPPGGLAQTRYLCKRLRAQFPGLRIVVGRWGLSEHSDRVREQLLSAGADQVVTTLIEARSQLLPWIQVLPHAQEARTSA
ncbi:MAG TPA: AI-2E family transporter [Gemmataceae bacterium]|nr:AI-2E family transporter [Gemmataceae bacterium]